MSKILERSNVKDKIDILLENLDERGRRVVCSRFGLDCKKCSLQAVGNFYNITRERIRQIENESLKTICASKDLKIVSPVLKEVEKFVSKHGGVVSDVYLLENLLKGDKKLYAYITFILNLSTGCNFGKFDSVLNDYWYSNKKTVELTKSLLSNIEKKLTKAHLVTESTLMNLINEESSKMANRSTEVSKRSQFENIVSLSKNIDSNFLDEYGISDLDEIKLSNTKSYIKLILRKNKKPMHFNDITKEIERNIGKKLNPQTCNNELVGSDEFVRVGNGIYNLKTSLKYKGSLTDAIKEIINSKKTKRATLKEISDEIRTERSVKQNTILKYLQDKTLFKKEANEYKIV